MKIAFISYWTCPLARPGVMTAGGMNVYMVQLALALATLGHQIDIFTRSHKEHGKEMVGLHKNIRVLHFPQTKKELVEDTEFFARKMEEFIKKEKIFYDIFHAHYYLSGVVTNYLKQSTGIPSIVTFHTLGALKKYYGGIKDPARMNLEKEVVANANKIIVSTLLEKRELIKYYKAVPGHIAVIPPGVNHNLFHPHDKRTSRKKLDLSKNRKIVLFVGRIDPIKGINFLVESIAYLVSKHPEYNNKFLVLIIGGDVHSRSFHQNKEVQKIKNLIIKKNLDCCVRFMSSQPHSLLSYYYSAADMVVMPSVYESFGLVVLEAMATGAAVVGTRVGGMKYLITDKVNGRLFESRNVQQLAQIIQDLGNDEAERKRLGEGALLESRKYCWSMQAQKMVQAYKNL